MPLALARRESAGDHERAVFLRNELGRFLDQRIQQGQYDIDQALKPALEAVFESLQTRSQGIAS
jgi:hypothetical protein